MTVANFSLSKVIISLAILTTFCVGVVIYVIFPLPGFFQMLRNLQVIVASVIFLVASAWFVRDLIPVIRSFMFKNGRAIYVEGESLIYIDDGIFRSPIADISKLKITGLSSLFFRNQLLIETTDGQRLYIPLFRLSESPADVLQSIESLREKAGRI